jgi:hypothetical protein
MTYPSSLDIARGLASGCRSFNKFGRNTSVGSSFVPVSRSGFYRTPQANAHVHLRIKAGGNANDTANGSGAREIVLIGIDEFGDYTTQALATAGASASAQTSKSFIRLFDVYVSKSGTYSTQTARSHAGTITIENAAGGEDWAVIADGTLARGKTEMAVYTTPRDRSAAVRNVTISSDSDKKANIVLYKRENILEVAAPYSSMLMVTEYPQSSGLIDVVFDPPLYFPPLCDFGFLANVSASTVDVSVNMDIIEFTTR